MAPGGTRLVTLVSAAPSPGQGDDTSLSCAPQVWGPLSWQPQEAETAVCFQADAPLQKK